MESEDDFDLFEPAEIILSSYALFILVMTS